MRPVHQQSLVEVHPRVCGESFLDDATAAQEGLSPACAGNPPSLPQASRRQAVHPRVCGESRRGDAGSTWPGGPSPACAGNPSPRRDRARPDGSIPACAGESRETRDVGAGEGVHPHVCGESPRGRVGVEVEQGPSPRVRGIHAGSPLGRHGQGSIPACAGNPSARSPESRTARVHPRVCGESKCCPRSRRRARGPSPRVRGILSPADRPPRRLRSIPACAGNPSASAGPAPSSRVHPRVCGESGTNLVYAALQQGPSPRVRGILLDALVQPLVLGSIPACAGNPRNALRGGRQLWVHPRVCGESRDNPLGPLRDKGPSPRVRGILIGPGGLVLALGSIPACAGNPERMDGRPIGIGVHPRVCGES